MRTPNVTGVIGNFNDNTKNTLCITDVFGRLQSPVYTPRSHLTATHYHSMKATYSVSQIKLHGLYEMIQYGLTSHSTHYRSFWR